MSEVVKVAIRDGIAVIEVRNPPVNALSVAVRKGLLEAVKKVGEDQAIEAAVIVGSGRTFPAGADIREFNAPAETPHLPDVCNAIEACPKPVVACLHGTALGGGYEIALAAHARLALPDARVGLPEIGLGLMPGAGGTQRLPRLVAVDDALSMILSGTPVSVGKNREKGYVDGIVDGDLVSAGVSFARSMVGQPLQPTSVRRERFRDGFGYQAAIDAARRSAGDGASRATRAILNCIEAAPLLPLDQGLALERDFFMELRQTDEAKALRHVFLATRAAGKARHGLPAPGSVSRVAIVGGGLMGSGIAVSCLDAGLDVTLIEHETLVERSCARIASIYDRAVARGKLSEEGREAKLALLTMGNKIDAARDADLVIEAIPDDRDLKVDLFQELARVAKPGAIFATNTSYLDVDDLAQASGRAESFVGLHFFSPAHIQQGMEVVVGAATSGQVEATAFAFAKAIRKKPVRSGNAEGFIGNRVLTAYRRAADYLLEGGASPSEIDEAMRAYGFKMGPYQVLDMAGLDISWARRKRSKEVETQGASYVRIGDAMCEAGRLGQKTGVGYYRYEEGSRTPLADPEALAIIEAERVAKRITPREISPEEIQQTCLMAMTNEGARLLDEGIAERAGDIDVLMILGLGFPRDRGGPMKASELKGLLTQLQALEELAIANEFWTPAQSLRDAVKNGNQF